MNNFLSSLKPHSYAIMRIVVGFLFLLHGTQNLWGLPIPLEGAAANGPMAIKLIAGTIELVGGTLIIVGFQTRIAAFICSGLMAVAYWMVYGSNAFFFQKFGMLALLPLVNHGELAAIYCFVFLFIATNGSGIWSVDSARSDS